MTDSSRRDHHRKEQTMNHSPHSLDATASTNIAVIRGTLTHDPRSRDLPGGATVLQFDVVTRVVTAGRATNVSLPVAWNDPSATQIALLAPGTEVLVVGTVRRRFFRVGAATQSRTEVIAEVVIPTRRRTQTAGALRAVADRLAQMAA